MSHDDQKPKRSDGIFANLPLLKEDAYRRTFAAFVGCYVLRKVVHLFLMKFGPSEFPTANLTRQNRAVLYVLSTIGNLLGTWFSVCCSGAPESKDPKKIEEAKYLTHIYLDFERGYLLHDAWATRAEWTKHPSDLIHHVLGVVAVTVTSIKFDQLWHLVAPMTRIECSTPLINLSWFAREFPSLFRNAPWLPPQFPRIFAAAFFAMRIVWYPHWIYTVSNTPRWEDLGKIGRNTLYSIFLLQVYWFALILRKVLN